MISRVRKGLAGWMRPRRASRKSLSRPALRKIPTGTSWRIADLGTGSGAVALALATERRFCEVHATDISQAAIQLAQENASRLGVCRIRFHQGSWSEPLQGQFHLIVSNPPYIGASDPHLKQGDCRFEPRKALTPGPDGLRAIRKISGLAREKLVDGGWLMFEHGWDQGPGVREIMEDAGFMGIETLRDLQGHERVTMGGKLVSA